MIPKFPMLIGKMTFHLWKQSIDKIFSIQGPTGWETVVLLHSDLEPWVAGKKFPGYIITTKDFWPCTRIKMSLKTKFFIEPFFRNWPFCVFPRLKYRQKWKKIAVLMLFNASISKQMSSIYSRGPQICSRDFIIPKL